MNVSWWIDEDKMVEVEKYCEKIIDGEYGFYDIDNRWDVLFDWDNDKFNELLFGYLFLFGGMYWFYDYEMFWQVVLFFFLKYFGFIDWGNCNFKYVLQLGLDLNGNEYFFENGKLVCKFMKYFDDVCLKKYKNLGNSKCEGMFLYGDLFYEMVNGMEYVILDNGVYKFYICD